MSKLGCDSMKQARAASAASQIFNDVKFAQAPNTTSMPLAPYLRK
jgi:hypothetical protein